MRKIATALVWICESSRTKSGFRLAYRLTQTWLGSLRQNSKWKYSRYWRAFEGSQTYQTTRAGHSLGSFKHRCSPRKIVCGSCGSTGALLGVYCWATNLGVVRFNFDLTSTRRALLSLMRMTNCPTRWLGRTLGPSNFCVHQLLPWDVVCSLASTLPTGLPYGVRLVHTQATPCTLVSKPFWLSLGMNDGLDSSSSGIVFGPTYAPTCSCHSDLVGRVT